MIDELRDPQQCAPGRENANRARRDPSRVARHRRRRAGPRRYYFGYKKMEDKPPVRAAIIGTGNEGCDAMIRQHNRDYLNYIGFCDARPSNQQRAASSSRCTTSTAGPKPQKLKQYDNYQKMLEDKDVEVVVIALPLWLHAPVAIEAMKAGKHVFTEKLMAHTVSQCKEMCRVARETNRLLAVGHQRHYSVLYDNANFLVQQNHLGDIRHIRALWHRNGARPMPKLKDGKPVYNPETGEPEYMKDDAGNVVHINDGWHPPIPDADKNVDFKSYGYNSLEELVRWRLYNRTGAGLMAELGSHQLDACSIFLGKKHPLTVTGIGGKFFFTDGRECDDHVFVNFEFPGKDWEEGKPDKGDHVVVTYSSINTNAFDKYGETLYGSRGTMMVEEEKEILLFKEGGGPAAANDEHRGGDDQRGQGRHRDEPERSRVPRRRRRLAAWPRPTRHAAIARNWSTSRTAYVTVTSRTSTTTRRINRAVGVRSPSPTP